MNSGEVSRFQAVLREISSCRACPRMVGTPVHGPLVITPIFLLGQAPGPHEAAKGRPFAHTAGKTLFRWFQEATGIDETAFREHVYMAAVARCFPGKAPGGGDRVPDATEVARCGQHLRREVQLLRPKLIIAVGKLAISQVLGPKLYGPNSLLTDVVGKKFEAIDFHGVAVDVICLPHPSGVSAWPKKEPGRQLLARALDLIRAHPQWIATV